MLYEFKATVFFSLGPLPEAVRGVTSRSGKVTSVFLLYVQAVLAP